LALDSGNPKGRLK